MTREGERAEVAVVFVTMLPPPPPSLTMQSAHQLVQFLEKSSWKIKSLDLSPAPPSLTGLWTLGLILAPVG